MSPLNTILTFWKAYGISNVIDSHVPLHDDSATSGESSLKFDFFVFTIFFWLFEVSSA